MRKPWFPWRSLVDNGVMASRLPFLITLAGVAVLFLSIAFVFALVLGAMFLGGLEFTGGHGDAAPAGIAFARAA